MGLYQGEEEEEEEEEEKQPMWRQTLRGFSFQASWVLASFICITDLGARSTCIDDSRCHGNPILIITGKTYFKCRFDPPKAPRLLSASAVRHEMRLIGNVLKGSSGVRGFRVD